MKTLWIAAALATTALAGAAHAAVTEVTIDDTGAVFPESMTSTKAGDLIIGSSGKGSVYRAKAGSAKATVFIDAAKSGIHSVLGVLADDASNTLYVCSVSPQGKPPEPEQSNLHTFDLKTGAVKKTYPMPGGAGAVCNDIALDKKGNAYISETVGGRVLVLKKGGSALEDWSKDDRFKGVDGIAFIQGDGKVVINTVTSGRMFTIVHKADGTAGDIVELTPSVKLGAPDGLRGIGGNKVLQAESRATRVSEVTIDGDKATVRVIKGDATNATGMTLVGKMVWINDSKFSYRQDPALKGKSPEPFTTVAVPLN